MFLPYLLVCACFVVGSLISMVGLITKANRPLIKAGMVVGLAPVALMLVYAGIDSLLTYSAPLHPSTRVEGVYKIIKATHLKIDDQVLKASTLTLKKDSSFFLSSIPGIELCNNGKFRLDMDTNNEIDFSCATGYRRAHIESWFNEIRIRFTIGDPDAEQSISFGRKGE